MTLSRTALGIEGTQLRFRISKIRRTSNQNLHHREVEAITGQRCYSSFLLTPTFPRTALAHRNAIRTTGIEKNGLAFNVNGTGFRLGGVRLQHSTPASSASSTTSIPSGPAPCDKDSSSRTTVNEAPTTEDGIRVLAIAADEGRRISKLDYVAANKSPKAVADASTSLVQTQSDATFQGAMNAARTLLGVTHGTDSLAPIILDKLSTSECSNETADDSDDVTCLHRAFLIVTQSCLNLIPPSNLSDAASARSLLLKENEVLDCALKLSIRAHDLSLPFHLPLYQSLAIAVAENSSMDPLKWIFRLANWTNFHIGHVDSTFFARPLVALCQRKRLADAANLIHTMNNVYGHKYIDPATTKEVLFLLKDLIRPIWAKVQSPPTRLEQDAVEIVLLLEASIWMILDYVPVEGENGGDNRGLREAVEAIMSTEEDAREALSSLEEMICDATRSSFLDSDDFDYDDDDDDDDYMDEDEIEHRTSTSTSSWDPKQDSNKQSVSGRLSGKRGAQLPMPGDKTNCGEGRFTSVEVDNDVDEDNEYLDSIIYGRLRHQGYRDLPDLASMLHEANGGLDLLYSKEFELHVIRQLSHKISDDDNDTPH